MGLVFILATGRDTIQSASGGRIRAALLDCAANAEGSNSHEED
jgi:hypothetical protein